jgi:trans-aconitate methyltransferase
MPASKTNWDAELYEAKHAFVWKFGQDLIALLDPKPGERVLDLGCGPGQLTRQLADRGAEVVGVDVSLEMIGQARQNYPELQFLLADASKLGFEGEFDAVFSNAALHWMLDASAVARSISRALRPRGRLVAEMGGRGNIAHIERAIADVLRTNGFSFENARRTFFPSVAEYSTLLEQAGLEVRFAELFDRPTPLEGTDGMKNWLKQFAWYYFENMPPGSREPALAAVVDRLRPELYVNGAWQADYRRLRVSALKI